MLTKVGIAYSSLFPSSRDVSVAVGGLLDGGVPEAKSEFCKQRVGGWLRYEASPTPHTSIKAFLHKRGWEPNP
jgi:hypothetical protein